MPWYTAIPQNCPFQKKNISHQIHQMAGGTLFSTTPSGQNSGVEAKSSAQAGSINAGTCDSGLAQIWILKCLQRWSKNYHVATHTGLYTSIRSLVWLSATYTLSFLVSEPQHIRHKNVRPCSFWRRVSALLLSNPDASQTAHPARM
jgi:hypothetical protein